MKNIEFYYDEIYKLETFPRALEFAQEKGFIPKIRTTAMQDVLTWLNEEHQILDKTEKRYLGNIIRPLKTKYTTVEKRRWGYNEESEYEYICINHLVDCLIEERLIFLPTFKAGEMYKGMEAGKEYTLEELGL